MNQKGQNYITLFQIGNSIDRRILKKNSFPWFPQKC